ncbi:Filamentous hemagglutinin [Phocoenobacter uteri]|uniref:Filamentous hemagglutinin n=1 Tax=Phocoenobacter uteri TaxID=146806 RepID=A0A379CA85_9PAST|nr:hemagglutinin repeat-containing protein [Phocoenobacter uteri]MDG6881149.1 hypothetical protein [Phocoenobacter uteri]SUB59171.1 Filamentous hemagglutinin [Phocoenobacter uteri]
MNKHCYRIIFSKTLNCLVVVSEITKAESKSSANSPQCKRKNKLVNLVQNITACIKPLCFSLFCALGFVSSSFADTLIIKADNTAPKNTQPIVLQTANGLPQVNIQTPNAKGLSHNKYTQFDVDTKGAILNNSRKTTQTKLGGYVQGNPYLARGEAKVILNEVNSNNPSLMKGYVEVAGQKADVIIANPSGISCQGCGILNSNQVTLTTGKPQIRDGQIESVNVEQGTVLISGKGLDNSQVDYTEILSQKAKINAGIWTKKKLAVVTGNNTIKRSDLDENLQIIHKKSPLTSSTSSQYSVDVSELGGMYAGQIHLVGTEQGLGVRNVGHIGAGVGEVAIDVNGKIINSGIINANQGITSKASDDVENTGKIEAKQNDILIKTKGALKQDGSIIAQKGNIKIKADKNITQQGETIAHKNIDYAAQKVNATTSSILASGVEITQTQKGENRQLETQSETGQNITVHTKETATLQGKNIASGKLEVNATAVNLDHSQSSGYDVKVTATKDNIDANSAKITAKNNVDLTIPKTLSTQHSHLKAKKITVSQQNLNTQNAVWEQTGNADFNLTADSIKNNAGYISTQGNFEVNTKQLENTKGTLLSDKQFSIKVSGKLDSTEGVIASKEDLSIDSDGLNNDKGLIQTNQNLALNTNGKLLSNKETLEKGIVAQGKINLKTATIANQQGRIASKGNQDIIATEIENTQGKIQTEDSFNVNAKNIVNHQGEISANHDAILTLSNNLSQQKGVVKAGELTIQAKRLQSENSSQILGNKIDIATQQDLSNKASAILANKDITLSSQQLDNTQGVISSKTQAVNINTHQQALNNTQGQIGAKGGLTVNSGELDNLTGIIKANENVTLITKAIDNQQGYIGSADKNVDIKAQQKFDNTKGRIEAKNNIDLLAKGINNQSGIIYTQQGHIDLNAQSQALNNQQGEIIAGENLSLTSGNLINTQGKLFANNDNNITAIHSMIDNSQAGKIQALGNLSVKAKQLNNQSGFIQSGKDNTLTIQENIINNRVVEQGSLIEAGKTLAITTNNINNQNTVATASQLAQGIIAESLELNALKLNNNKGGVYIQKQGELIISKILDNQSGEILGWQDLTIEGFDTNLEINNHKGKMQAQNNLDISAKHLSMNGHLEAKNLSIKLKDDVVSEQDINAKNNLSIVTQGDITNSKKLSANNRLILNASNIENIAEGKISSEETRITAQNKVTNRGLINSFSENNQSKTVIKAKTIHNLGTGRIYGDYMALGAENILNQDESVNGEDKSATIAARKRLDIAGKEIINDTTLYNPDKKGGSTIYSEGDIVFGRSLNVNDQAEGKAETLKNKSSIIEAVGSVGLHIDDITNSNEHYLGKLLETSSKDVSKYYILPQGIATGSEPYNNGKLNYINTDKLYWAGFSRAGKWVENVNAKEPALITNIDQIRSNTLLAEPNTVKCQDDNDSSSCKVIEASIYTKDNPIWTYFNITPPDTERPEEPNIDIKEYLKKTGIDVDNLSDEQLDELEENLTPPIMPTKPIKPLKKLTETDESFQLRLAQYNLDKAEYNKAVTLQKEFEKFKPILDWTNKNGNKLKELSKKISQHNKWIYGEEYYRYWNIWVNKEVVKETMTLASLPGQILAGKDIYYNSKQFLNDKSIVIAGNKLTQSGQGRIENRDDEEAIRQDIELGSRNWSYSKWRGGVKRYHERRSSNYGPLKRINETHKDMNLFLTKDHTNPTTYKDYIDVKKQNNITQKQNEVVLNDLSKFDTKKQDSEASRDINVVNVNTSLKLENTQVSQPSVLEIRSIEVDARLPNQGLYRINPKPNSHFVVETDPEFTNHKKWLSSDYMFNALRYDPNNVQKRLGDGFYEQKLVREQINRLTGRQFLGNHSDFEAQYKSLMHNGITFAKRFNLGLGIALSEAQVAQLTSDIVWLESKSITLPNGKVEQVLVPKVYAMAHKGDITGNGTLISANRLKMNANEIINEGTIAGRKFAQLNANKLKNSGKLSAEKLEAHINGDVENIGGVIEAERDLLLDVAGNLTHRSTTQTTKVDLDGFKRTQTTLDRKALLHVKGKDGKLHINANNINITGADIINDGQGQSYISAKNNLNLTALEVGFDEKMGYGNHYRNENVQDVEISHIKTKGDMILKGKNIVSEGAELESQSKLTAIAENDLVLNGATRKSDFEEYHYTKHSSTFSKSTHTTFDQKNKILKKGSELSAEKITLVAGHDIKAKGAVIVADNDVDILAKNNINIGEDVQSLKEEHFEKKTKSGLLSSGGIGFTIGSRKETKESDHAKLYAKGSQVGSLSGKVNIVANNDYKQSVSTVTSVKDDVTIKAKQVDIVAGDDKYETNSKYTFEQKGLTVAVNVPALQAIQAGINTAKSIEKVGKSKNDRVNAMAAANAAWDAARTYETIGDAAKATEALANGDMANANVSVSITYGEQKNTQQSSTKGTIANSSKVNAGGKANIIAIGDKTSNINIVGSDVSGIKGTQLLAENEVNVLAKSQTHQERSSNKSQGWNAGVAVSYGSDGFAMGVTAGGNYGKGYGNGDEQSWVASRVGDKNSQTTIVSKNDTTLKGAQVVGKGVSIEAKDLNIESLQDTMTYKGKQKNMSGQVTVGYGVSGSASYSQSKVNADYASVNTQAGVFAGDDGFKVNVKKHTNLKGGLITSTEKAEQEGKNSFVTGTVTTSNIDNHANHSASGFGISGGVSVSGKDLGQGKATENPHLEDVAGKGGVSKSLGYGSDKDSQSNTTTAGVGTQNITITDKAKQQNLQSDVLTNPSGIQTKYHTKQALNQKGLENNFDAKAVQSEVELQVEVTREFDKTRQGVKAKIYQEADKRREEAVQIRKENSVEGKNGYSTKESLALDDKADTLEKVAFYTDLALGGLYGYGNSDALTYMGVATTVDPAIRAATTPAQVWEVKCKQDGLYCSNKSYDGKTVRPIYGDKAEIGDKRQIFALSELTPSNTTGVITVSNNGILNPRDDALKNAIKQNKWETNKDGIAVVYNRPTSNVVSELIYALYDKTNDLAGGRLPLTSAEKMNIKIYDYAKQNNYQLDLNNHSRGGLTASVALQKANRDGLKEIPIRESRFFGTATNVQDYSNQLANVNKYTHTVQNTDGTTSQQGSQVLSAVHYTDFVGRTPLIGFRSKYLVGGNKPTGGVEDKWFLYSHSSYVGEVPTENLIDDNGRFIDEKGNRVSKKINNPYRKEFKEVWSLDENNKNLSLPIVIKPE